MIRFTWLTAALLLSMLAANQAVAQSFLDRLEGIIGGAPAGPVVESREPGYLGLTVDRNGRGELSVIEVDPDSPAARAGLRKGDRILKINGTVLASVDAMGDILQPLRVGDRIDLEYQRGGKTMSTKLTMASIPPQAPALERLETQIEELAPPPPPESLPEVRERGTLLGVRVEPITAERRRRYNLAVSEGVVVEEVVRGSPADRAGLTVGTAIVAVAGLRITSSDQLAGLVQRSRPGSEVEVSYYRGRQLVRTRVRLAAAPPPETPLRLDGDRNPPLPGPPLAGNLPRDLPPSTTPGATGPLFSGDRPAGRILNRVLQEVQQAERRPPGDDPQELKQHIELLERYIDTLQGRIEQLEAELEQQRR